MKAATPVPNAHSDLCRLVIALLVVILAACSPKDARQKVTLELHLMASCPFAREALTALLPVLDALDEHVALDIHYIGRVRDGQLDTLYGAAEQAQAKNALCALSLGGARAWRTYAACTLKGDGKGCAEAAGLKSADLTACSDGAKGDALLRASYQQSEQLKVSASPTLTVAGKPYELARTEGLFARALCRELDSVDYCEKLPAPTPVRVTLITDRRCKGESCDGSAFLRFVQRNLPAASVRELDYSTPEARDLLQKSGQATLPLAIFDAALEREQAIFSRLAPALTRLPEGAGHVFTIGREWDPKHAI